MHNRCRREKLAAQAAQPSAASWTDISACGLSSDAPLLSREYLCPYQPRQELGRRVSLGLYFSMLGFPPHSCWWKHLLFCCLSTPTPVSLPPGHLSYFYLKASLLAKAMLLCPSSHLHHAEAWPACSTDTVPSSTPLSLPQSFRSPGH